MDFYNVTPLSDDSNKLQLPPHFLSKWIVTPHCFYFLSNWMKIPKAAWSDTSWVSWHQLLQSETRRSNITNASLINISHIFQPLWSSNFYDATLQQTTSCIIIRNQNHGSIVFFWSHCFKTRISDISRKHFWGAIVSESLVDLKPERRFMVAVTFPLLDM